MAKQLPAQGGGRAAGRGWEVGGAGGGGGLSTFPKFAFWKGSRAERPDGNRSAPPISHREGLCLEKGDTILLPTTRSFLF